MTDKTLPGVHELEAQLADALEPTAAEAKCPGSKRVVFAQPGEQSICPVCKRRRKVTAFGRLRTHKAWSA